MSHLIIRHKVNDYATWQTAFDGFADTRKAGGEKSFQIFHADQDPNNVYVLFEWESPEKASQFLESDELKQAMVNAGVAEPPEIHHLNHITGSTL